ncbi:phage integrase N-terminal SAM-like domain-containing protein [uncultured Cetobacterium sp.]|uniref:tyrosine-type recombinase/integrase n=1 Tax=uncultured Cetobacterium sp. TaxID=527638 RepID=UPI00262F34F1|nr:phage integrase N-terminal SAM-like domain-containing protein [uncultured Cetobacterium sp.]
MDLLKEFLEYKLKSSDIKKETLEMYQGDIKDFQNFIQKNLLEVSQEEILHYVEFLKSRYQPNSVSRKISTLKGLYRYLLKKRIIDFIPTDGIVVEKFTERQLEILEVWEINNILTVCEKNPKGERDKLLIKLLMETNFSINDVLKMRLLDLELSSYDYVLSDDGNGRIYISEDLKVELKNFIENDRIKILENSSDLLFYGLSRQAFRARFIGLGVKAGIERSISPNMLRNTLKSVVKLENEKDGVNSVIGIKEKYFQIGIGDD